MEARPRLALQRLESTLMSFNLQQRVSPGRGFVPRHGERGRSIKGERNHRGAASYQRHYTRGSWGMGAACASPLV